MGSQREKKSGQNGASNLHDMRRQAHERGIEGSSKMTAEQINTALKLADKGSDPMMAKQKAKGQTK